MTGTMTTGGRYLNSGDGPQLVPLDIHHPTHWALVDPATAFWTLVHQDHLAEVLQGGGPVASYRAKQQDFASEMAMLRFGLQPAAVYFNPTDLCNLDCSYCYIPRDMRRHGSHMSRPRLLEALTRLDHYFGDKAGRKPRVIFHGAEPMLNFQAVRAGIEAFHHRFDFGIQTNATLLDDEAIAFLTRHDISIGLSLDGPSPEVTHRTRKARDGRLEVHGAVLRALDKLQGYPHQSVIVTVTRENLAFLSQVTTLLHDLGLPTCLLNVTRCTLPAAREQRLTDDEVAGPFLAALEQTHRLFRQTGRKLVVANFANILLAILAPTARRLMCDISPCGGGRAFFAVAANGDLFPCSEFIGLPAFCGGNLFDSGVASALTSPAFAQVTQRDVDRMTPCNRCAIRHFCGAPCPAEAHAMRGDIAQPGAYCGFYEEQVRFAFRLIAEGREQDFLWDGWDQAAGMATWLDYASP